MFKRNSISAGALSSIVFAMLCLFPSVVSAQGSQEQQQKDPPPLKGSRSNIHYNKTGVGRFDPIMIHLGKASGDTVATRKIADADNDGKLSEAESVFDFGALPAGDYVLTLGRLNEKIDSVQTALAGRISITGAGGGKIEKDWKLEAKAADATSPGQRVSGLSTQINGLRIPFKADRQTRIAGRVVVDRPVKRPQ